MVGMPDVGRRGSLDEPWRPIHGICIVVDKNEAFFRAGMAWRCLDGKGPEPRRHGGNCHLKHRLMNCKQSA